MNKRYITRYDHSTGSHGTWDLDECVFVAHAGSEAGSKVQTRRMNEPLSWSTGPVRASYVTLDKL
jgi:hypothetical protein